MQLKREAEHSREERMEQEKEDVQAMGEPRLQGQKAEKQNVMQLRNHQSNKLY